MKISKTRLLKLEREIDAYIATDMFPSLAWVEPDREQRGYWKVTVQMWNGKDYNKGGKNDVHVETGLDSQIRAEAWLDEFLKQYKMKKPCTVWINDVPLPEDWQEETTEDTMRKGSLA